MVVVFQLTWSLGIAIWLLVTCGLCIFYLPTNSNRWIVWPLLFFNNLNIFIACCEICLVWRIQFIQTDYQALRKKYGGGREWDAIMALFFREIQPSDLISTHNWARMWSNYALFDPSYQNPESFGFWIDVGNGFTTIVPCLLLNWVMMVPPVDTTNRVYPPEFIETLHWLVPCVTIASYWQMLYGTIIYFATFLFNQRYRGHHLISIMAFVLLTNGIWMVFPSLAIFCAVRIVQEGSFRVFSVG